MALSVPMPAMALGRPRLDLVLQRPAAGEPLHAKVFIVSGKALGAYTLELLFDPNVVQVRSIDAGTSEGFTTGPFSNSAQFAKGAARFSAFQANRLDGPTGRIHIADVTLTHAGTSRLVRLALRAVTVADTFGKRYAVPKRTKVIWLPAH